MTTRSSSMDLPESATPDTSIEMEDTSNRRKSGRARQKPQLLSQPDPDMSTASNGSGQKRKRINDVDGTLEVPSNEEPESESSDAGSDPDEEELKDRRRKAKRQSSRPAPKKSKSSKPKPTALAVRPALNGSKRTTKIPRSRAQIANAADDGTGLYGKRVYTKLSTSAYTDCIQLRFLPRTRIVIPPPNIGLTHGTRTRPKRCAIS